MPYLRRFDTAPMIQPILFKTVVYWTVVFMVRFLEKLVEYHSGSLLFALECCSKSFWFEHLRPG